MTNALSVVVAVLFVACAIAFVVVVFRKSLSRALGLGPPSTQGSKLPAKGLPPSGPPAKALGRSATLGAEGRLLLRLQLEKDPSPPEVDFPVYWSAKGKRLGLKSPALRREVQEKSLQAVQALMDGTWSDIRTRDRGQGGLQKFQVVQVLRIENRMLWQRYAQLRTRIAMACEKRPDFVRHQVRTNQLAETNESLAEMLRKMQLLDGANDFLLFHGTNPSAAYEICEKGFNVNLAGTSTGTLYGPGIYLAEASSKADEYAHDDRGGLYQGLYAMLLCRATCGVMNVCDAVKPDVEGLVSSVVRKGTHHSVLGDREKARGTYREFVLFDSHQAYPELIVIYRRYTQETE